MAPLLQVKDLRVKFHSDFGDRIVTDDISFHVMEGETLGIVGESGCGKSVTNLAIMGLLSRNGSVEHGSALFDGKNLLALPERELDTYRGRDIAMVFQDALASLDPVFSVGNQIEEQIRRHLKKSKEQARAMALQDLQDVGIPDPQETLRKYPSELSGGMRQRIMIAMALSCSPRLLVADEPTTALDVTIQAQIMQLIRKKAKERHMSVILITHDIGVIAQNADRVMVMYAGQFVEEAAVEELFAHPLHPYTKGLLSAIPIPSIHVDRKRIVMSGEVTSPINPKPGCRFAARCPYADERCRSELPQVEEILPDHFCACHKVRELNEL